MKLRTRFLSSQGFTLIEVLVVGAVLVIAALIWATAEVQRARFAPRERHQFILKNENLALGQIARTIPPCAIKAATLCGAPHPYQDLVLNGRVGCEELTSAQLNTSPVAILLNPNPIPIASTPTCNSLYKNFQLLDYAANKSNVEDLIKAVLHWPNRGPPGRIPPPHLEQSGLLSRDYFLSTLLPQLRRANCLECHGRDPQLTGPAIFQYDFREYDHFVRGKADPPNRLPPLVYVSILNSKLGQKMLPRSTQEIGGLFPSSLQTLPRRASIRHRLEFDPATIRFWVISVLDIPPPKADEHHTEQHYQISTPLIGVK